MQNLRYKDYQLVIKPAALVRDSDSQVKDLHKDRETGLREIETVKDFAQVMQDRDLYQWWRKGMGYAGHDP